jgi:hypothetical protein
MLLIQLEKILNIYRGGLAPQILMGSNFNGAPKKKIATKKKINN